MAKKILQKKKINTRCVINGVNDFFYEKNLIETLFKS